MRARFCIPVWTYEESFYTALLEGTLMRIGTDPVKGKGLFAKQPIASGECVHEETALVCSQNMDDAVAAIPVCLHCLRSLETPRRVVGRVCQSKKTALALPFGALLAPETPVKCVFSRLGCSSEFCSTRCREAAWNGYHFALCQGRMETEGQREAYDAFFVYDWVQNGVDFSDTAMLALRSIGQFLTRHRMHRLSLEESFLPFAQLIKAPIDKFYFPYLLNGDVGKEKKDGGGERSVSTANSERTGTEEGAGKDELTLAKEKAAYEEWQQVKQNPLSSEAVRQHYGAGERTKEEFIQETLAMVYRMLAFTDEEREFISPTRWSELFGSVLLNGQERSPPSHYSLLKDAAVTALADVGGAKTWEEFEACVRQSHPHVDLEDLNCSTRGQGIYTVGCLFNHSCQPNLQVAYACHNDETLSVTALRDIDAGEELCISYIEERMSFPKRQEQLYEHYLFECGCPLCMAESPSYR